MPFILWGAYFLVPHGVSGTVWYDFLQCVTVNNPPWKFLLGGVKCSYVCCLLPLTWSAFALSWVVHRVNRHAKPKGPWTWLYLSLLSQSLNSSIETCHNRNGVSGPWQHCQRLSTPQGPACSGMQSCWSHSETGRFSLFRHKGLVVLKVHRQPVIQEEDINHFNIHSHTKTAFIIIGVSGDSVPLWSDT